MPDVYSGQIEPTWIAKPGALVYEDVFSSSGSPATAVPTNPNYDPTGPGTPSRPIVDRYSNRIGLRTDQ